MKKKYHEVVEQRYALQNKWHSIVIVCRKQNPTEIRAEGRVRKAIVGRQFMQKNAG